MTSDLFDYKNHLKWWCPDTFLEKDYLIVAPSVALSGNNDPVAAVEHDDEATTIDRTK